MFDKQEIIDRRLERLISLMERNNLDGLLLADVRNIYWATLSTESSIFLTNEGRKIERVSERHPQTIRGRGRIGIDSHVSVEKLIELKVSLEQVALVSDELERVQMIKDGLEVALISRAAQIANKAWESVESDFWCNTQTDLCSALLDGVLRFGGDNFSFDPSVAPDLESSQVWSKPERTGLGDSSIVVVDFGASFRGYHSDIARTVVSKSAREFGEYHQKLSDLHKEIIGQCRPGQSVSEVVKSASTLSTRMGVELDKSILLGHGIGLRVHTHPFFSEQSYEVLRPGMTFSLEPALVLPGGYGMRIEDVVVIQEDGPFVPSRG